MIGEKANGQELFAYFIRGWFTERENRGIGKEVSLA